MTLTSLPSHAEKLNIEAIYGSTSLAGPAPRGLKVSPDGARVTFLRGREQDQFQLDLWEFNLHDKTTRMLVDSKLLQANEQLSDQEKARRERARTAGLRGIISYSWSPDGKQILVPLAGDLYLVDLAHADQARKIASGSVLDAKISPKGRYVSFVRDQNLFVVNLASGKESQLTRDGGGSIHNAEAEFVAQEEMAQTSGYWWAPDDSAIAFKRFDESLVPNVKRFEIYANHTEVIEQRYPYAGAANVQVALAVVSPDSGAIRQIDLGSNKDIYLVRADWMRDARHLVYQRQSRDQKHLDLVAVDVGNMQQRTLVSETSKTWVSILDKPYFLEHDKSFIWTSERSGRKHLYLYDLEGKLLHAISQGEWGIDGLLAVDEKAGQVYVASNRDAATDKQVYALPLDGSKAGQPKRITLADGWHDIQFSKQGNIFIDTWSNPDTPPQVSLRNADGSMLTWIEHNELNDSHPYARYRGAHVPTEFGTLKSEDGQTLHYSLRKPLNFEAGKRYPVFLVVYGGPGAQTVERKWGSLFDQYMAQQGYVVFRLDNRGSARRERQFTDAIYGELGRHEVADQVAGIDWLARQDFVDAKRIGVFGWSYGGFMSLRLLSAASDKIAAGVSVAPVTDWALYDSHYTEQFISHPKDNVAGYQKSNVFAHLDGLRSPLLLVHGMADDNVLFSNSTQLIDALASRGILFDLMTYPGAKHGISGPANQKHVYRTIEAFFKRKLAKNQ
ncbi:S9 family peptidase [Undibacterium sp.]|uniref:S9 family peptidase n=1 Tax=Undibacterium sp. TaxID=1914977 RepID=UPI002BE5AC06|nr:S9 family peptidase [Undibacterium sp.]HTD06184.1 S9 family peptidase [Undibacterium sp.]